MSNAVNDDDLVFCVQVREVDPPQFLAEDEDELTDIDGDILSLEQCDRCGLTAFLVHAETRTVVCCGSEDLASERLDLPMADIHAALYGCETIYPIRLRPSKEVSF